MNTSRLLRLVNILTEIDDHVFDMNTWFEFDLDNGPSGCACGWGALDPILNGQGFKLLVEFYSTDGSVPVKSILVNNLAELLELGNTAESDWECELIFEKATGMDAVAQFFEVSFDIAHWLFGIRAGDELPKEVRARINKLLTA